MFITISCSHKKEVEVLVDKPKKSINRIGLKLGSFRVANLFKLSKIKKKTIFPEEYLVKESIKWGESIFYTKGKYKGEAVLKILEASISEKAINKQEGFLDLFYIESEYEITMKLKVNLEIYEKNKDFKGKIIGYSKITFSISEGISVNERNKLIEESKEELFLSLASSLEKELSNKFNNQLDISSR